MVKMYLYNFLQSITFFFYLTGEVQEINKTTSLQKSNKYLSITNNDMIGEIETNGWVSKSKILYLKYLSSSKAF